MLSSSTIFLFSSTESLQSLFVPRVFPVSESAISDATKEVVDVGDAMIRYGDRSGWGGVMLKTRG